jgi:hypothetical protein
MSVHDLCRSFLKATRVTLTRSNFGHRPHDQRWSITGTSDRRYWIVQDADGKTVWEGDSCCAYAARTEALMKLAEREPS